MAQIKKVSCSSCGKLIDTDDQFCGYCCSKNDKYDAAVKKRVDVVSERNDRIRRLIFTILLMIIVSAAIIFLL